MCASCSVHFLHTIGALDDHIIAAWIYNSFYKLDIQLVVCYAIVCDVWFLVVSSAGLCGYYCYLSLP